MKTSTWITLRAPRARSGALAPTPCSTCLGMHVLTVDRQPDRVVLTVESDADVGGCPACGVVAVGHGRRRRVVADAPCFGVPVRLVWLARLWRCREPACPVGVFTEQHDLVPPRAKLTSRAAAWATDALTVRRHHRLRAGPPPRGGLAHLLGRGRGRGHPAAGRPGPPGRRGGPRASTSTSGDRPGSGTPTGR